uniref:Uncharacterized protein n=1 Tax=Melopsittacus undulatus TaxID=13146 RepID=A0A8C6IVC9_MELUD
QIKCSSSVYLWVSLIFTLLKGWKWWHMPVVPATQEAEPAGLLEPRSSGLQCAMLSRRPC